MTHIKTFKINTGKTSEFIQTLRDRFQKFEVIERYPIREGMLNMSIMFWN